MEVLHMIKSFAVIEHNLHELTLYLCVARTWRNGVVGTTIVWRQQMLFWNRGGGEVVIPRGPWER